MAKQRQGGGKAAKATESAQPSKKKKKNSPKQKQPAQAGTRLRLANMADRFPKQDSGHCPLRCGFCISCLIAKGDAENSARISQMYNNFSGTPMRRYY